MNPTRIEIDNIGAIDHGEHDLEGIRMAVVVGANGRGKSTTFTTTPTWVLFGTTKNDCALDDMIRAGQNDMAGTLEFQHRGDKYRVTRTRSKRGRGKSTLELYVLQDTGWESVGGDSIAETQAKIKEIIGLDADTFTTSSMIMQGKANEFSTRKPAQRKAVLTQILGLDKYATLQDQAKDRLAKANATMMSIQAKMDQLAIPPGAWELATSTQRRLETSIALSDGRIKGKEQELKEAETEQAKRLQMTVRQQELITQARQLREETEEREHAINKEWAIIDKAQKLLDQEEKIKQAATEYDQIKEALAGQEAVRAQASELQRDLANLRNQHREADEKSKALTRKQAAITEELADRKRIEDAVRDYHGAEKQLVAMEILAGEYEDRTRAASAAENKYEMAKLAHEQEIRTQKAEVERYAGKVDMLSNANCVDPDNATCRFLIDARGAKPLLERAKQKLQEMRGDNEELELLLQAKMAAKEAQTRTGYDLIAHRQVSERVRKLRPAVATLAALEGKSQLLDIVNERLKEAQGAAGTLWVTISAKANSWSALTETIDHYDTQEGMLASLKPYVDLLPDLRNAEATKRASSERIKVLHAELATRAAQVQAKTQEAQELEEAIYGQPAPNPNDIRQAIEDERQYGHELRMSLGRAKAELENIEAAETQRGELGKELEPLATDAVRWQTLVRAFGKDGVPAMIIEHAVPDLEYQANDILGQMTRGKNQLYFNTQRDRRNGPGVIETLDIMITDGETPEGRPYETYSGGEQLRIDFALRIALSEMLARRAGSKVEWLTIDEGIGSQDSIHRALVLEAIRNISDRFQTVILITHIEEAQAMFDDIINI